MMSFLKDYRLCSKIFSNKLFSVHVQGMRIGGYLIDENQKFELCHFWRSAFLTLSVAISCALQFGKIILKDRGSAMSSATAFLYLTTSIALINAFFRRKKLARMLAFLQEDADRLLANTDEREALFFEETYRYMHMITVCVWIPSLLAGIIAYIDAFYRLALKPDSIFNLEEVRNGTGTQALLIKLFPYRELHDDLFVGYIFPMYSLLLGITSIPLWHTFITSLMSYVILKLRIMQKRFSEMDVSKVVLNQRESTTYLQISGDENRNNYLRTRICKFSVIEQNRIRWFVTNLQELIYIPVFADFIIFSILICFLFYEMSTGNQTKMDFLFMCLYLFVMATILWLYHWHATLVKENSELMGFAVYSCDWYNYPVNVQKMVQIVMMITAYPLEMKALFVPLNLTTFIDIIRASYSYFSILRNSS